MDGVAESCSSAIAPALPYYSPSMDIYIFRTSHVHVGRMLRIVWNDFSALLTDNCKLTTANFI